MIAALVMAAALSADPATLAHMAPAFANTIVSTYPDGRQGRLYLAADGTWRALSRAGKPSRGSWSVKGERVCMHQSRPIPLPFGYCTPIVPGGVGTRWSAKAPTGEPITTQLVAGRADEPAG
ncbi:MAG: hypothetical protein INR64_03110 [Caulobacteraceae bacterium]|nr:hypothetical protein [Caulobacter sp.]